METMKYDAAGSLKFIRQTYGISQKSLGILLGISEPSIVRYEAGSQPSKSNAMLIKLAANPVFMKSCFDDMGDLIPVNQQRSMREKLSALLARGNESVRDRQSDNERISAAMNYIAARCKAPYFSRVIKGCFIADSLSYEKNGYSLLGLQYAHAPHGPVIDGHKELRNQLEQEGLVELVDDGFGFLFDTSKCDVGSSTQFDDDEIRLLDEAACFVDSFETINELSEATHELSGWQQTKNGQTIPFRRNSEVTAYVEDRLYEPNDSLIARIRESSGETASSFISLDELLAEQPC